MTKGKLLIVNFGSGLQGNAVPSAVMEEIHNLALTLLMNPASRHLVSTAINAPRVEVRIVDGDVCMVIDDSGSAQSIQQTNFGPEVVAIEKDEPHRLIIQIFSAEIGRVFCDHHVMCRELGNLCDVHGVNDALA